MSENTFISTQSIQTVGNAVDQFKLISLEEMDNVTLMDRMDMKFILPFPVLEPVLADMKPEYRVLTLCNRKVFGYRTDYYDTPEWVMFFDHHNGKLNRFKIRYREYLDSQLRFLEVKFRSNKGRIIKQRIEDCAADRQLFNDFIAKHTPYNPQSLNCTVTSYFNRCTFVNDQMGERVTADFNLVFSDSVRNISLNRLAIIEIKQDHADTTSKIYQALKRYSIRPATLSKYCIGLSLLKQPLKMNNFKPIIMNIKKLSHVEFS